MSPPKGGSGHDAKCNADTRSGGKCGLDAGWGTDHVGVGRCRKHGGNTISHRKAAAGQTVSRELGRLGVIMEAGEEPTELLMRLVWSSWANVAVLSVLAADLDPAAMDPRTGAVLARYDFERDRAATYTNMAIRNGLAERSVRVSERQGDLVAKVIMALLDDPELGLSREQRDHGRRLAGRHLRALGAGEAA